MTKYSTIWLRGKTMGSRNANLPSFLNIHSRLSLISPNCNQAEDLFQVTLCALRSILHICRVTRPKSVQVLGQWPWSWVNVSSINPFFLVNYQKLESRHFAGDPLFIAGHNYWYYSVIKEHCWLASDTKHNHPVKHRSKQWAKLKLSTCDFEVMCAMSLFNYLDDERKQKAFFEKLFYILISDQCIGFSCSI